MAASVDIAGAAAPAASAPHMPGHARTCGATRCANASGKTRSAGASAAGKATAEAGATDAFDAQLDAVLPDADGSGKAKGKASATGRAAQPASAERDSKEEAPDQVATAVPTPWPFVPPVDATPAVVDDSIGAAGPVEASAGEQVSVGQSVASSVTLDEGRNGRSGSSSDAKEISSLQTPLAQTPGEPDTVRPEAQSTAVMPATEANGTGRIDVSSSKATSEETIRTDPESALPQVAGAKEPSAPGSAPGRDPERPNAPDASSTSTGAPAVAATRVPQSVPTSDAQQPVATTSDPSSASSRSVEAAAAGAAPSAVSTEVTAAAEQSDAQSAAEAASATPGGGVRANGARGDEPSVKGRSAASHLQQRHAVQTTASRDTDKERRGAAVDAPANLAAVDDQRRNGSPADADLSASKAAAVTGGSDNPPHEAPPAASATRVIHPTLSAMPATDGIRQASVDGAALAQAPAAPAADVPDAETPHRLVQSLRMQFLRGGGDAIVQLRPEHLGQVTVSLRVEQGSVAARITAADPVVAEWLQAHQDSLREGLQANGLTLDRLSVDRDGQSPDRRGRREPPPRQRFRQTADPQSTFELTI